MFLIAIAAGLFVVGAIAYYTLIALVALLGHRHGPRPWY